MNTLHLGRPSAEEYAPYFGGYINLVPGDDVLGCLAEQHKETLALLQSLSETQGEYRYAPEKWSIKELCGHINDCERIFVYRTLCIARGDTTPLPGFEQDDYIANGNFAARTMSDLAAEFDAVRTATLTLLRSFDAEAWQRRGTSNEMTLTTRAAAFIIAGHELHHRAILWTRYLHNDAASA